MIDLNKEIIRYLKGVGQNRAEKFQKLGIETVADLLTFYPKRYDDLTKVVKFLDAQADEKVAVVATVM